MKQYWLKIHWPGALQTFPTHQLYFLIQQEKEKKEEKKENEKKKEEEEEEEEEGLQVRDF